MNFPQHIGIRIIATVAGLGMGIMFSYAALAACVGISEGYVIPFAFIFAFSSFAAYGSFRMAYLGAMGRDEYGDPLWKDPDPNCLESAIARQRSSERSGSGPRTID